MSANTTKGGSGDEKVGSRISDATMAVGQQIAEQSPGLNDRMKAAKARASKSLDWAKKLLLPTYQLSADFGEISQDFKKSLMAVGLVSLFTNALMLTGPLYMLQIYDRVLASRSGQTLLALTLLVIGLYMMMGILEAVRSAMMTRIAAVFETRHSDRVFRGNALLPVRLFGTRERPDPVRDLDQCRGFLSSPAPLALFDLPWLPIYLGIVFLMHPALGFLGTVGAALLVVVMLLNDKMSRTPIQETSGHVQARSALANSVRSNPGAVLGMGMMANLAIVWFERTKQLLASQTLAGDRAGMFSALTKCSRMFLQSAVLGLGAYLAILEQISPGMMIAASIITARALAPVEQTIGNWRNVVSSRQAFKRLGAVLDITKTEAKEIKLPPPTKTLTVEKLVSGPAQSQIILKGATFSLKAGDGLGIIGPSGSGKTTLIRAILGIWPALGGAVRFDGSTIDQWDPERIGTSIGYLPQDVEMFEGTIAANVSRFDPDASVEAVMDAVSMAGVHELIASLPEGYSTVIGEGKMSLSAGQRQRIGLARALYGDPFIVILDEPNSNLDADGDKLLSKAIAGVRDRGGIVIVVAHRPSALSAVDKVLVMKEGRAEEFGPKNKILARTVRNPKAMQAAGGLKVVGDVERTS
ncbi:MAG: type I secretion system permease/ATPase [Pseudomonadota bacterium]